MEIILDKEIGKAHLLASPIFRPEKTTVRYTSNKTICQKTNLISRCNLKITWPLDSNQLLPQSILFQWKEGKKYIFENGLWTRLNDNTMIWIFFHCQQIHFMCATHNQHDLRSQIFQSQSTQVMLRVSVGSSTSWHIEHRTSESSLFDSSSETSTQTLLFFSATENVNGKVDCFLLRWIFSTTISTFSLWSPLDGCEGAAQLINDDELFIKQSVLTFLKQLLSFCYDSKWNILGILFHTL